MAKKDNSVKTDEFNPRELKKKLAAAEKQATEHLDGWKRARADYLNLKKDFDRQSRELFETARAGVIAEILPIYNHFKLALKHLPEDQKNCDWLKGIFQIQKEFRKFLESHQIEEIKTEGEKFNPEIHEAITSEPRPGIASEIIFEEVQPGYRLAGQVLVPAKVKVAE